MRSLTLFVAATLLAAAPLAPTASAQTCSTSWTDAAGGAWTDAANWDNGVPTVTDDACVTLDGTYAVTVAGFSVNSLTLGDAGNAGTQTLVQTAAFSLAAGGTVAASGDLEWRNGYLETGTLTNAGLVRLDGSGSSRGVRSNTGGTFRNEGTVAHVDGGIFYVFGNDARVENAGLWDVQADGDLRGFNGAQAVFANEAGGVFQKSGSTGISRIQSSPLVFENAGTVAALSGELRFERPSTHTDATLDAAAGAVLRFNTGGVTFAGTTAGAPAGTVQISDAVTGDDATWDVGGTGITWQNGYLGTGTVTNTGLVRLDGAGGSRGVSSSSGALFRNEGTVEHVDAGIFYVFGNSARAENAGLWDIQSDGELRGFNGAQAVFANEAGGVFQKSGGTQTSTVQSSPLVFENAGTVAALSGTLRFLRPSTLTGGTLDASAGAVLTFNASPTFVGTVSGTPAGTVQLAAVPVAGADAVWDVGGTGLRWQSGYLADGQITNTGLVVSLGGGVNSGTGATFRNEGTVEQPGAANFFVYGNDARAENAGLWHLLDGGDLRGFNGAMSVFANESGGTLRKSGPGTSAVQVSPLVFENAGTVEVLEGELTLARPSTQSGTLTTADGAVLRFQGQPPTFVGTSTGTQAGELRLETPPVGGAGGTWDFDGTGLLWQSGYLGTGTIANAGLVRIINGGVQSATGATFRNEGTVEQPTANAVFVYGNDARVENAGLWDVQAGGDLRGFNGAMSVFTNTADGTYRVSGGTAGVFTAPLAFVNAGMISVADGAELDVDRPFDHQDGARVQGDGTVDVFSATLTHDGDIAPGTSPGLLTWQGAYEPSAASALRIEIGGSAAGTDYDQLAVQGAATLAGDLVLSVADGALPTVGDSYTILTAPSVAGTFADIVGPDGFAFDVVYNASDVVVTVTAVGVSTLLTGAEGWRMLAPSVTGQTLDGLLAERWTQGFPGSDEPGFGTPNVFVYDETAPGDASQGYAAPSDQSDAVALGTGVFAYVFADDDFDGPDAPGFPKTIVQSGTDVTGVVPIPVSFTASGGPDEDGWTLAGNPYAASLDWTDPAWTRTNVDATAYVWDPTSGQYLTHDTVTGSLPDGLVAPAQGFWVQATAASPVLTAPASARTTGGTFLGRTDAAVAELRVRRTSDADGTRAASAHVVLADGAADGRDRLDAFELTSLAPDALGLWTEREDGAALDIQALPPGDRQVPVGVAAWAQGAPADAALVMTWPALPEGVAATLTDHATGETVDLGAASEYAFTLDAGETVGGTASAPGALAAPPRQRTAAARFTLTLGGEPVADEADAPAFVTELLAPAPNPTRGATSLRYTVAEAGPVTVMVHDLLGRTVARLADGDAAAGPHTVRLDTASLAAGVYVVRMTAPGFSGVQRLTVVR